MPFKATRCLLILLIILGLPALSLPSEVKQEIGEEKIRSVIEEFVRQKTAGLGADISIKKFGKIRKIFVPSGLVEYEVVAPQQWEGWGNSSLAVIVRVDGNVKENIPVRVEVEALVDMVVTTRQVEQGEILGSSDIVMKKRDLSSSGGKICRNPGDVVGKRAKISLRGNIPVRSDHVEKIPLVKNGQIVTILLENELIRVTASGRSKGSGGAGDTIIVQNMASQKEIPARVLDATTVRVEF